MGPNAPAGAAFWVVRGGSFDWAPGSRFTYLFDRQTGLWRSGDFGQTWAHIWKKPSPPDMTGYVVADAARPGRVYVSAADGLFVLDRAESGTVESRVVRVTRVSGVSNPGAMTIDKSGFVFVARRSSSAAPAALFRGNDPKGPWIPVEDETYRFAAGFPNSIAAGPDGYIYVALNGNGLMAGSGKPK
jgi:hypothetical protein